MRSKDENNRSPLTEYPLFNQVEDTEQRVYNSAVIMCNIFEDYGDTKVHTTSRGLYYMMSYFKKLKVEDKPLVLDALKAVMESRGLCLENTSTK